MKVQVKEHVARHHPWTVVQFVRHLPNFFRLFLRLLSDQRVSAWAKALLVGAAIYAVSPLDFLPDLMPVLGQVDDLTLFVMACRWFIQLCPRGVVQEHVQRLDRSGEFRPFQGAP